MEMIRGDIDRLIGDRGVNDPTVIEAMVVEYHALVYRLALSILRDPADAEDVVQDTYIQAAAGLHRYQVGTNFKSWLLRIAVNNCRILWRKRVARRTLHQAWESFISIGFYQPGTEAQVVQDETRDELWTLVDSLDEKHRLVVVLRLAHEMTVSEISQVLGVNDKTVYTRLYDAFARLRAIIKMRPEFAHLAEEVRP
jgi:RNA polymerase sigma-70 factor (ECF subfamily)